MSLSIDIISAFHCLSLLYIHCSKLPHHVYLDNYQSILLQHYFNTSASVTTTISSVATSDSSLFTCRVVVDDEDSTVLTDTAQLLVLGKIKNSNLGLSFCT